MKMVFDGSDGWGHPWWRWRSTASAIDTEAAGAERGG